MQYILISSNLAMIFSSFVFRYVFMLEDPHEFLDSYDSIFLVTKDFIFLVTKISAISASMKISDDLGHLVAHLVGWPEPSGQLPEAQPGPSRPMMMGSSAVPGTFWRSLSRLTPSGRTPPDEPCLSRFVT